jgi:hypothetical protein
MRAIFLYLTPLFVAGIVLSVVPMATAVAQPADCADTTQTTTLCQRPGGFELTSTPGQTALDSGFWADSGFGWGPWG